MLSFKQYLKEENIKHNTPECIIRFIVALNFAAELTKSGTTQAQIMEKLNKRFPKSTFTFHSNESDCYFVCQIDIDTSKPFLKEEQNQIVKELIDLIGRDYYKETGDEPYLYIEGFPNHFVECIAVRLTSDVKGIHIYNLKDIYKVIDCKRLTIWGSYDIYSHVLGILKIKNLKTFSYDNEDVEDVPNREPWQVTIEKYTKTKDILACHEELVDNGLEDYAQF